MNHTLCSKVSLIFVLYIKLYAALHANLKEIQLTEQTTG